MKEFKFESETSDSCTTKSESSIETNNIKSQENRQLPSYSWCVPRKTRAVSSTGEIFIDLTQNLKLKKKKSEKRSKTAQIYHKALPSQKRINELARPRQIVCRSSEKSPQCKVISNKRRNDSSRPEQELKLTKSSELSLSNFEIDEKTTDLGTILRQNRLERINKLAEPRVREHVPTNIIGKVSEKALRATASERIKKLAQKKPSTSADPQKKDGDPYRVNPQALKAICSDRTKSLAIPRIFKLHAHFCNTEKSA